MRRHAFPPFFSASCYSVEPLTVMVSDCQRTRAQKRTERTETPVPVKVFWTAQVSRVRPQFSIPLFSQGFAVRPSFAFMCKTGLVAQENVKVSES